MRYAQLLKPGDTIGVCAPSSGISGKLVERLDNAIANVRALGYEVIETASVRGDVKCASADAGTRAAEFMSLYENPQVSAIVPPWGGEFLMDMLPYIDFKRLSELPAKWVCGYSDVTTLTFAMTVCCDMATVHGSNLMNMGCAAIHESDLAAFDAMSKQEITQKNSGFWGGFTSWDDNAKPVYSLTEKTVWKSLDGKKRDKMEGRMLGGCLDVMSVLIGTRFAPVTAFLEKYRNDGFVWTLESAEMSAAEIYRALWHMRECGWFNYASGILFGRPDGYSDTRNFTLADALEKGLSGLGIPVIYDADIGHIPPQMQIVNGAYGTVDFNDGNAVVSQRHIA